MKTKLLIAITVLFAVSEINAQTTHNLNWFTGIGSNVDLTIDVGDTVIWTWTSPNHTVESVPGNSVETFTSGFLGPNGSTYSYTFTVVGANDYLCGVHGAFSMSGTITVENNLGVNDFKIGESFKLSPNPSNSLITLSFRNIINQGSIDIYDLTGKVVFNKKLSNSNVDSIDVSDWSEGLYLILVKSDEGSQTKRFVKHH
jgi:hypothetical protein